jgi:hypothetical protein
MQTTPSSRRLVVAPNTDTVTDDAVLRSCIIRGFNGDHPFLEKTLYFKTISSASEHLLRRDTGDCDDWARLLVMEAMALRAELQIMGGVSRRLLENLNEFQRLWGTWLRAQRPIRITTNGIREENGTTTKASAGCSFSGGVDSVFSVLFAKREQSRGLIEYSLEQGIYVHGFEVPLSKKECYASRLSSNRILAKKLGIHLIPASTNARQELRTDWGFLHGIATVAAVSQLRPRINTCLIPSSYTYNNLNPWGSHPLSDPLASSKDLRVIHHGCGFDRVAKLDYIRKRNESLLPYLVFCNNASSLSANCGNCEKCLRTRTALLLVDVDIPELFGSDNSITSECDRIAAHIRGRPLRISSWRELHQHANISPRQSHREISRHIEEILNRATAREPSNTSGRP